MSVEVEPAASVVLPTYNEAATIAHVVSGVRHHTARDVEVVVVDDGDDSTADLVREQWKSDPSVQLIERGGHGLASAVLRGFDAARADVLAVMDADLQHPPTALPVLLKGIDAGADMVVGSRRSESGDVAEDWPLYRQVVSHAGTWLAWLAVPQARATTDPMSGFFAIRSAVVDAVRDDLDPAGYKIGLELLARCPIVELAEFGYSFERRQGGQSSLGPREYVDYVRHLGRLTIPARRNEATPSVVGADG